MKKIVLATTALVSVAYAGSALAQESMVMFPQGAEASIGGFYQFGYGSYQDDDEAEDLGADSGSHSDTELFIFFSRTTDNGLTFGMDVQLESGTSAGNSDFTSSKVVDGDDGVTGEVAIPGNSDEASIYVQGDFGRIVLGENDRASDDFQTWAPTHARTYGTDDVPVARGPQFTEEQGIPSVVVPFAGNPSYNDRAKIAYFTPDFSGFSFGVSWEDSGGSGEEADVSLGASYNADLSGLDLTLNVAAENNGEDEAAEKSSIAYGIAVGWNDLSLTASHTSFEVGNATDADETGAETTGFGVGYQINDQLSVGGYYANADHDASNQSADIVSLSAEYTIATGLTTTLAWNQFDIEQAVEGSSTPATNEGREIVFEVSVQF